MACGLIQASSKVQEVLLKFYPDGTISPTNLVELLTSISEVLGPSEAHALVQTAVADLGGSSIDGSLDVAHFMSWLTDELESSALVDVVVLAPWLKEPLRIACAPLINIEELKSIVATKLGLEKDCLNHFRTGKLKRLSAVIAGDLPKTGDVAQLEMIVDRVPDACPKDYTSWAQHTPLLQEYQYVGKRIPQTELRAIQLKQFNELTAFVARVLDSSFIYGRDGKRALFHAKDESVASLNMYILNDAFVMPLTRPFCSSYVELVASSEQPPNVFVSHWWGTPLWQTARLLNFYTAERSWGDDVAMWICTLANTQHDLSELAAKVDESPFARAIRHERCQGTVALLDGEVTTFKRIWCVLENFISTVETGSTTTKFYDLAAWLPEGTQIFGGRAVPGKATAQLDLGLEKFVTRVQDRDMKGPGGGGTFPFDVARKGMAIDLAKAESSRIEDKRAILHYVAGTSEADLFLDPPEQHERYDALNRVLRQRFASAMLYANALKGDAAQIAMILEGFPDAVNSHIIGGATPILAAAMNGHVDVLQLLLQSEADLEKARENDGITPLLAAIQKGQEKTVETLLAAGANPNKAKASGATPLFIAAQAGKVTCLELLLAARAEVDQEKDDGSTPVCIAVVQGQVAALATLLLAGADTNKAEPLDGCAAMHSASKAGNVEAMRLLLEGRANINLEMKNQATPLHLAAQEGNQDAINFLLAAGASVEMKMDGKTAADLAADVGHQEIATLLRLRIRSNS